MPSEHRNACVLFATGAWPGALAAPASAGPQPRRLGAATVARSFVVMPTSAWRFDEVCFMSGAIAAWRSTSDLGDLLASSTNRPATTDVAAAAARYDGATLRTAEEARDRAQQVRVADLRRRFVDGPVLTTPAPGGGTSDTTGSIGIPGVRYRVLSQFHHLRPVGPSHADNGVLRSADGATLSVPVAGPVEGTALRGEGWSATLNSG
jgi:hypothetical protein